MIKEEMINGMIELIKSLPDSDKHIYESEGQFFVTNEWLVGNFAGRSFNSNTIEGAIKQLIIHCSGHLGHSSIAGDCITKSGFPDLFRMRKYLNDTNQI
jgi:transcription elongation factor GreA-like protein